MMMLGLETSTALCGVALASDDGWSAERVVFEPHLHSEKLLTLVNDITREAAIRLEDLAGVSVSIGPGSFTGLRIGLSSAKGLCYALEKPLLTVPTFDAIAAHAAMRETSGGQLVIAVDAKRNDYYVAVYTLHEGRARNDEEVSVVHEEDLVRRLRAVPDALVVTDRTEHLAQVVGSSLRIEPLVGYCHASTVATIGLKKLLAKEFSDLASTEPLYLKNFLVVSKSTSPHTSRQ